MDVPEPRVWVRLPRLALESIFQECDRFESEETGGRLIGTFEVGSDGRLVITVCGVIEPGPGARRTATSFFQDGGYQEGVFRRLEAEQGEIEHLGNWHTHHVNGYPTLSGGDRVTYHRIVNHPKHNLDFFYALLVTERLAERERGLRYNVKHFILFRDRSGEFVIPSSQVSVIDAPIVWPRTSAGEKAKALEKERTPTHYSRRASDDEFFGALFSSIKPFRSKATGNIYWRGPIVLCDDSMVDIVVAELEEDGRWVYRIAAKGLPQPVDDVARGFVDRRFGCARDAVVLLQRELNRRIWRDAIPSVEGER